MWYLFLSVLELVNTLNPQIGISQSNKIPIFLLITEVIVILILKHLWPWKRHNKQNHFA